MKLLGIMSLKEQRTVVRDLLRAHDVAIYSETEILGHSTRCGRSWCPWNG